MKKSAIVLLCICLVIVLASCGRQITPNEPFDMSEGVEIGEFKDMEFTICSYNIKGGAATYDSVNKIKDNIERVGADIAGLQEVDHLSNRTGKADFLSIFKKHSLLSNTAYFPVDIQGFGDTYGIATVSKNTLNKAHSFKLPYPYKNEKPNVEKRIVMRALVKINGVQIAFYNTHLSYEEETMSDGKTLRQAQFDYLVTLLQSDPCPYKVVTGDFNVLSFEEFESLKENGYKIVNNEKNIFNTYRGNDVTFKAIDNIIYSDRLEVVNCGMTEDDCSDHNMLYAKFRTINK